MVTPLTETSHPRTKRINCRIAINEKTIIDTTVNVFTSSPLLWRYTGNLERVRISATAHCLVSNRGIRNDGANADHSDERQENSICRE